MANRVEVTACPNCGAPVDPSTIDINDPLCKYCGRALPTVAAHEPPAPPSITFTTIPTVAPGRTRSAGGCITAVIIATATAIGIGVAAIAISSHGLQLTPNSIVYGQPVPGPVNGQFYVDLYASGSSGGWTPAAVDAIHHKLLWRSAVLQGDQSTRSIVSTSSAVAVVTGSTVVGLDPASGKQRWQASLADDPPSGCSRDCVALAANHLVVLSKDGTVQSIDAANGRQSWSTRLHSTPRWLKSAGAAVLADDQVSDTDSGHAVVVFDAATGAARRLTPQCAQDPNTPFDPQRPEGPPGYLVDPGGDAMTILTAGIDGCALRIRLADGAVVWQTPPATDGAVPSSLNGESPPILGGGAVVWTNGGTLEAVDLATGAIRPVFSQKSVTYTVAGVVRGTLVVQAAPSSDSSTPNVWGIDLASGQRRWQIASRMRSGQAEDQQVRVTASGVLISSCKRRGSAGECTFEAVDPIGGNILGTSTVRAGIIPTVEAATVIGEVEIANVDDGPVAVIDGRNATVTMSWPS